jgi:hypothetical protein
MILLILLAQLAAVKTMPQPVWAETPVPHWSCPSGWRVEKARADAPIVVEPSCVRLGPTTAQLYGFNPSTEELITWEWVKTVPASGKLRVDYPAEFLRMPGCLIPEPIDGFSDESKSGFTLHAKPGRKLHLNCRGVVAR